MDISMATFIQLATQLKDVAGLSFVCWLLWYSYKFHFPNALREVREMSAEHIKEIKDMATRQGDRDAEHLRQSREILDKLDDTMNRLQSTVQEVLRAKGR